MVHRSRAPTPDEARESVRIDSAGGRPAGPWAFASHGCCRRAWVAQVRADLGIWMHVVVAQWVVLHRRPPLPRVVGTGREHASYGLYCAVLRRPCGCFLIGAYSSSTAKAHVRRWQLACARSAPERRRCRDANAVLTRYLSARSCVPAFLWPAWQSIQARVGSASATRTGDGTWRRQCEPG